MGQTYHCPTVAISSHFDHTALQQPPATERHINLPRKASLNCKYSPNIPKKRHTSLLRKQTRLTRIFGFNEESSVTTRVTSPSANASLKSLQKCWNCRHVIQVQLCISCFLHFHFKDGGDTFPQNNGDSLFLVVYQEQNGRNVMSY